MEELRCVSRPHVRGTTDANVATVWVEGVKYPVVNGSFDVVVGLVKGKNRITVEVVDPAGNARDEEVVVRYGATGSEAGVLATVVAGALVARWAMLGGREKRGRPHVVPSRGAG
jgi:hypothetical protein